jgi:hypothetical protein
MLAIIKIDRIKEETNIEQLRSIVDTKIIVLLIR